MFRQLRVAIRRWQHRPAVALTAVVALAMGIGATTAMFAVVDAALIRPLPWPNGDRLVAVYATFTDRQSDPLWASSWNRQSL